MHPVGTPSSLVIDRLAWRDGGFTPGTRCIPEEMPVAFSYNRLSHAVMMATPADLEDFARGFSLNERIVSDLAEIEEIERVDLPAGVGIEMRLWIDPGRMAGLESRRRRIAGPTGCGLCGIESLKEAIAVPGDPVPAGHAVEAAEIMAAMAAMRPAQALNRETRAVHAAGFFRPGSGLLALREDVGRHNALDKLAGALSVAGQDAADGILVMSSRISVELVQKAQRMGATILAAVSAPTALAIRTAQAAGLTLIAVGREDGFELCTHPQRILGSGGT
ncbi:formate dehydrogenase accessory sulfurtransferase FdhD [Lichenicoccus sp.]|uniref:formate dehydrogenase accessory sulfurtransferase FdhD n=1 Tax=Lichenicoccus sp. TaxID=2781899 RepID=UPI003D109DB0